MPHRIQCAYMASSEVMCWHRKCKLVVHSIGPLAFFNNRRIASIFIRGGHDDGGTEGPERGAKRQPAPPQYGVWGRRNFRKINLEIAHFPLVYQRDTIHQLQSSHLSVIQWLNFFSIHDGGVHSPMSPLATPLFNNAFNRRSPVFRQILNMGTAFPLEMATAYNVVLV